MLKSSFLDSFSTRNLTRKTLWMIKKEERLKEPKRFPDRYDDLRSWMEDTIAWYKFKKYPVWQLFSPYYGAYFPIAIHSGFSFDEVAKQAYRDIKERYPEYIQEARNNFRDSYYSYSRIGVYEDYDPQHDYKVMP